MNLARLDALKAQAQEAYLRGRLRDAGRLYDELLPVYERHGFEEGVLAVAYNRLLVALEDGDRPRAAEMSERIRGHLGGQGGVEGPTPRRVATGILGLLEAVEGPAAVALRDLRPAAEACAAQAAVRYVSPDRGAILEADPTAEGLERLGATDSARLLLAAAAPSPPPANDRAAQADFATAARALASALETRPRESADPFPDLEAYRAATQAGDPLRAYQSLVAAFERSWRAVPALAGELLVGLVGMEQAGLPERIEYSPALPIERRLHLSVRVHTLVAQALSGLAGWEALARVHWGRVVELCERWIDRAQARRARGGGRAADTDDEAQVCVWLARALRHREGFAAAEAAMVPCVRRAYRGAYTHLGTAAVVLAEAADLAERRGDAPAAATLYLDAAEAALPGIAQAAAISQLVSLVDDAVGDERGELVPVAARAVAGVSRCQGGLDAAQPWLVRARRLLSLARCRCHPGPWTRASLEVELSAVRWGEPRALSALEHARALNDAPAIALAALHVGLDTLAQGEDRRARGLAGLALAGEEAHRSAAGVARWRVELAIACAHLDLGGEGDAARIPVHVRRAAEACRDGFVPGAGEVERFLRPVEGDALEAVCGALLERGMPELALLLCRARGAARPEPSAAGGPLAATVRAYHQALFEAQWAPGGAVAPAANALIGARLLGDGIGEALPIASDEAVIELHSFKTWLLGFVVRAGETPRVHRWQISQAELAAEVAELLRCLRRPDPARLARQAEHLDQLLIAPLVGRLGGATRLRICPHGPLTSLPFALLLGAGERLCERYDLSIARRLSLIASRPQEGASASPSALIVGDGATTADLRLSTLARDGLYESVQTRHGADLQGLQAALRGASLVHLVGPVGPGSIGLADDAPTPLGALASALASGGCVAATLMGPAEGEVGLEAIDALLSGVRGAVLARRWAADEDASFLVHFVRLAAGAQGTADLVRALGEVRRMAIRTDVPPRVWAAFELYVPDPV